MNELALTRHGRERMARRGFDAIDLALLRRSGVETAAIGDAQGEGNARTHRPDAHAPAPPGIPFRIPMSGDIH